MVPPTWNERGRVEEYIALMEQGTVPTAVAISTAIDLGDDYFAHWSLPPGWSTGTRGQDSKKMT